MKAKPCRASELALFSLAVLIWGLTTFPSVHLRNLYTRHHLIGSAGAHPELFAAYLSRVVWVTAVLSFLGPLCLWSFPRKLRSQTAFILFAGAALGIGAGIVLLSSLASVFRFVSGFPLQADNFIYSGLLTGIITAEINRRASLGHAFALRSALQLKRDFYVTAFMTWAVLLKILEGLYLLSAQPGKAGFGIHIFMFLSVLLWTPLVCKFLWRYQPGRAIYGVFFACIAGIVLPPLVSLLLAVPVTIMMYAGITPSYGMLWGLAFYNVIDPWGPYLFIFPGTLWGFIIGFSRWRYLSLEQETELEGTSVEPM
jgi:hypothetical protein